MPTNVVMPQMGESIAEGTIVRWIKKVGDEVDRDEPLFEISTDKVDAEIPSPAAGVLTDIKVKEGETVPINAVVAVIGGAAAGADAAPAAAAPEPAAGGESSLPQAAAGQPETVSPDASAEGDADDEDAQDADSRDDLRRQKSSPLVRRIAKEHNVDLKLVKGTGISGRVTKQDILGFLESGPRPDTTAAAARQAPQPGPAFQPGENVAIVPMP